MPSGGPGRNCPLSYRYGAAALAGPALLRTETLWVAGGVYGNPFALERLLELYEREAGAKALVLNGDFHWFDVDREQFASIERMRAPHLALRGNVESELAQPDAGAGCGCGYPDWVPDTEVERSNRIIERLRATAQLFPQRFTTLPMYRVAEVGGVRVAIVHGDADSLAGWGFSQEVLATAPGRAAAMAAFERADVSVFASSHTCLPVLQCFGEAHAIVNNGAAGMPNFSGAAFGLVTRVSARRSEKALYRARAGGVLVEAVALDYDSAAWQRAFLAQWPQGSDAYRSYYSRIASGPRYRIEQALRRETALAA
jgi:predicted phosphodiesterase